MLVGTALELAILIFEVPTGAFADTYGRRRSVIVGFLLIGAGFSFEGAVPVFAAVLTAQLVWGVGYTFISGALQAWIADELGQVAGGPAIGAVGTLAGIRAALALAAITLSPALPLYASAIRRGDARK